MMDARAMGWATRWLVGTLVVALAGLGCKKKEPTPAELIAEMRPKLEPMLAVLERIAKAPLPAATGKITLAGPPLRVIRLFETPVAGNAAVAFDADLKNDLTWIARVDVRGASSSGLPNDCFMLARKGTMAGIHDKMFDRDPMIWDEEATKRVLPACGLLRYLVVVKMLEFRATKYIDKKSFGGGAARAEVLVFDLGANGAFAGGVPIAVESSASTKTDIDSDLMVNFEKELDRAIRAHLPEARL